MVLVLPMADFNHCHGFLARARVHARRTARTVLKCNTGGERRLRLPPAF